MSWSLLLISDWSLQDHTDKLLWGVQTPYTSVSLQSSNLSRHSLLRRSLYIAELDLMCYYYWWLDYLPDCVGAWSELFGVELWPTTAIHLCCAGSWFLFVLLELLMDRVVAGKLMRAPISLILVLQSASRCEPRALCFAFVRDRCGQWFRLTTPRWACSCDFR